MILHIPRMPFLDDAQRWPLPISPLHDLYIPWLLSFVLFLSFFYIYSSWISSLLASGMHRGLLFDYILTFGCVLSMPDLTAWVLWMDIGKIVFAFSLILRDVFTARLLSILRS